MDPLYLQAFVTGMVEPVVLRTDNNLAYQKMEWRQVDIPGTLGVDFIPAGWPKNGANGTGDVCPSYVAVLLKGVSSDGVAPGRIRKFFAGVPENYTLTSYIDTPYYANWLTSLATMQAYIDSGPALRPVAVRYSLPPNPVVNAWNEIATLTISSVLAIMSSRKVGRGA
jgi:hypothetical protein